MKKLKGKITVLSKHFDKKASRKLQIAQFLRLLTTLESLKIEDKKLMDEIEQLIASLELIKNGDLSQIKNYSKSYFNLKQKLQKNYSIIEKGTYTNMSLGIGMTMGLTIGIVLSAVLSTMPRSQFIVVGMMMGMAMGAVVGSIREKKMNDMGKNY